MQFINFNDKLYYVYRKMREKNIKPGATEFILSLWHCDVALKQNEDVFFCRIIEDAEIVTE